jgi:hypothetical protein
MFAVEMSMPDLRIDDVGWEEMFPSTHWLDILRTVLAPIRRLKFQPRMTQRDMSMMLYLMLGPLWLVCHACRTRNWIEFYPPMRWSLGYGEDSEML